MRRFLLLLLLIVAAAGCNLDNTDSVVLVSTPSPPPTLPFIPTLTPRGETAPVITPIPEAQLLASPEPPPATENAIEVVVNNVLIPVWNFLYTLVVDGLSSLWLFAGARGGLFAQIFCCIFPGILVLILIFMRRRIIFWRR